MATRQMEITIDVVTPAYAGGADPLKTDGLRPPVLKGLLREWWRALHPDLTSDELFDREEQIFGSTRVGQGLRFIPVETRFTPEPPGQPVSPVLAYGAYGPVQYVRQIKSTCTVGERLPPGTKATFRLAIPLRHTTFPRKGPPVTRALTPDEADRRVQEVKAALWLLGAFGGIGSRWRRGNGGLQIRVDGFPDIGGARTDAELADVLRDGVERAVPQRAACTALPEHPAFFAGTAVFVGPPRVGGANAALRALEDALRPYLELRRTLGTTHNHGPKKQPVGEDFITMIHYPGSAEGMASPRGAALGLPLTHRAGGNESHIQVKVPRVKGPGDEDGSGGGKDDTDRNRFTGRRASPVVLRVCRTAGGYVPVVLFLISRFLPDDYEVHLVRGGVSRGKLLHPSPALYDVLEGPSGTEPSTLKRWVDGRPYPDAAYQGFGHRKWLRAI